MRVKRDPATGTLCHVADEAAGYEGWDDLGPLPEDWSADSYRFDDTAGAYVVDWTLLDAALHAKIDAEAGAFRCRFITDVPGQQLTYQRKEDEARRWAAAPEPKSVTDYPFLAAEAAAIGLDADGAAAEIIAAADLWAGIGSAIEGARIGAKRAVSAAMARADKEAAAIVDWEGLVG